MPRALKVYRMPVGFHDAYVATSSQKDAIAAWGSDKDVFTRGQAEIVTDPILTEEPLASPGKVLKRLRATAAEQIEALGEAPGRAPKAKQSATKAKSKPRPSRAKLDEAEEAIESAESRHAEAMKQLAKREAELRSERDSLEAEHGRQVEALKVKRDKQRSAYDEALRKWRG